MILAHFRGFWRNFCNRPRIRKYAMLFQCKDKTRSMDWYSSQNCGWIYASVNDSMQISVLLANTIILDYKLILNLCKNYRSRKEWIRFYYPLYRSYFRQYLTELSKGADWQLKWRLIFHTQYSLPWYPRVFFAHTSTYIYCVLEWNWRALPWSRALSEKYLEFRLSGLP